MEVTYSVFWILFSLSDAAITGTPPNANVCAGEFISLKWAYDTANIFAVEWKINGTLMLQYIPSQPVNNQYTYSGGYTSAKLTHITNGEINITSLTTSDNGNYSCQTTYTSGTPSVFEEEMVLTVYDMISTNLTCSYNQSVDTIDCSVTIPSSITAVTINGADYPTPTWPISGTNSATYTVCMAGNAANCRNDGIPQCISFEGRSPTAKTSTVYLMERMTTTTNFISDFNNITAFRTSDLVSSTSGIFVTPSNFESDIIILNSSGKISTSVFDADVPNSTHISMSSEKSLKYTNRSEMIDITKSHITTILLPSLDFYTITTLSFASSTTRFLMSNLISSSDLLNLFSSQTEYIISPYIFETSFLGTSALKSDTSFSIPDAISDTILTITKLPTVLLKNISTSSDNLFSMYDTVMHTTDVVDADTTTRKYFSVLQTHQPESTATVLNEQLSSLETSQYLPTNSSSDMTFKSSLFESLSYTSDTEDDIIKTKVQISGFSSSISINLSQSIGTSSSLKTRNSLIATSIFESNSTTTVSRMFSSDYSQSSFYPTEQLLSSRTTEYLMTSMQATNSFLVLRTKNNPSSVNSDIMISESKSSVHTVQKTDMLTIQNNSHTRTTIENSDLRTSLVTINSEYEHQLNSSMPNHSFSRSIAVTSFITEQSTIRNSFSSLLYSSDSSKVILSTRTPFSYATSSSVFISTTIHSTSNTRAGISETTKSAIFITIVSVVVIIIILFSSIMLLSRVTFERKAVNVSLSNESQFPYMKRAIYPRFSDSLSSYMTSPYERNWHEV